jgi:hypothetical protein
MKKEVMTTDMVSLTSFFSETEMEGIEPLSDGEDLFFPAIECAKRGARIIPVQTKLRNPPRNMV